VDHPAPTPETECFWVIAEPLLGEPGTTVGTLMRFPCLRVDGNFFATCDHRTGDLIVKLPRQRVGELIDSGDARPFAPAGRTFKEWASISHRDDDTWRALLTEAHAYALGRQIS
jgi:hypothetical protein